MFAQKRTSRTKKQQQDDLKQQRRDKLEQQEQETMLQATLAQEAEEEERRQQQQKLKQQQQAQQQQQQQKPTENDKRLKDLEKAYLSTIPQELDDDSDDDVDVEKVTSKKNSKNNKKQQQQQQPSKKKNNKNGAESDDDDDASDDENESDDDEMMSDNFSFFQDEYDADDDSRKKRHPYQLSDDEEEEDSDDDDENNGHSLADSVLKSIIENDNDDDEEDEDEDDEEENGEAMSDDDDEEGIDSEVDGGEEDEDNDDDEQVPESGDEEEDAEEGETTTAVDEEATPSMADAEEEEDNTELPDDQLKDFDMKGRSKKRKSSKSTDDDSDVENELEKGDYDKSFFAADDEEADAPEIAKDITFNEMSLARPLKKAIDAMGFIHPTPIQAKTIPVLLKGNDICASAVTGSGKTAAFLLPTLEKLLYRNRNEKAVRALVLLPTRELASQCFNVAAKLARFTDITMCLVVGGDVNQKQQTDALRRCPDLVIATPGRIVDHLLNTANFGLEGVEILVLDEADRLLELGFQPQLEEVINNIPKARQTMLFSATMTDSVSELIKLSLKNPRRIAIDNRADVSTTLEQEFVRIRGRNEIWREGVLMSLVTRTFTEQVIIFVNRKDTARRLVILFKVKKLKVSELHGNLSQAQRLSELKKFTVGKTNYMICTDVAARGLDIKNVKTVINYEMPAELKTYIHRVGRTARAGQSGTSVSLTGEEDRIVLKQIVKRAKSNGESIKHRVVPNETILYWTQKIEDMAKQIKDIEMSNEAERELERAEMKASKMKNLVEFAGEIATRPKKEWVMSKVAEKKLGKREREEKGVDATGKRMKKEVGDVSQAQPVKKEKDRKNMTRRELRKEAEKKLEQQALQQHGIKNLDKFMKGNKAKARTTERLTQKGIKVPEIVEAKKQQEAKKAERRDMKKEARRAKREAKHKDKSAEKRETEKIEKELYKSTKPKKSAKTKQRYKRR